LPRMDVGRPHLLGERPGYVVHAEAVHGLPVTRFFRWTDETFHVDDEYKIGSVRPCTAM
jgi:hypothetical protein